jgi:hypothetical protein
MTTAFSSFPHPTDIRGWRPAQQPPRMAREQGSALSRAFGSISAGRKSFLRARLTHRNAIDRRCQTLQTATCLLAAMTKSP